MELSMRFVKKMALSIKPLLSTPRIKWSYGKKNRTLKEMMNAI